MKGRKAQSGCPGLLLNVSFFFPCVCVCVCIFVSVQVSAVPEEARRGASSSLEMELQAVESYLAWVLGTEFRSSARAVGHLTLSLLPAPR